MWILGLYGLTQIFFSPDRTFSCIITRTQIGNYTLTSWRLSKKSKSSRPILKLEITSQLCRRELIGQKNFEDLNYVES